MNVAIVPAIHDHIPLIAASIREADRQELHAIGCVSPEEGLRLSLQNSSAAWTGMIKGSPVCMFGVSPEPVLQGVGMPWMIGTEELERHAMAFLRHCKPYLAEMFKGFVVLQNYVDCRNTTAIQWLKWLGFKLDEARPVGRLGFLFHRFEMRRGFLAYSEDVNICEQERTLAPAPIIRRKATERGRAMGLKELMKEKEEKWEEVERLINRIGVLHDDLRSLHQEVVRGFPSRKSFPYGMDVSSNTHRMRDAFLAVIKEGPTPLNSLIELAEKDTRYAESMDQSHGQEWGK